MFEPRFLLLEELYDLKGGRESVVEVLAHLDAADHDKHVLLAIQWAEGRLRSLVTSRYGSSLPPDPASSSAEIKGLVADLARYNLALEHTDNASPNVITIGDKAIAQLRDVAAGRASLDLPETVAADQTVPVLYVAEDEERQAFVDPLLRRLPRGRW